MKKQAPKKVAPENPEALLKLRLRKPKETAAGLTGVKVAMEHVIGEVGVIRGLSALAKLNQKSGFDCPGCAWPDPDDERSPVAEYCENGAKAIAEEATAKKLDSSFLKRILSAP